MRPPTLRTDLAAVRTNVHTFAGATTSRIMAVVKADAYGAGMLPVALAAVDSGAAALGVTDVADGVRLRDAGAAVPILAWLHPAGIDALAAAAHRIAVAVASPDELSEVLVQQPRGLAVHLHLDVGMARGGAPEHDWAELMRRCRLGERVGAIRVLGLMGHLPSAADPASNACAVRAMLRALRRARDAGLRPGVSHLAATAATLIDRETHLDMVRVGAGLVGIDPSARVELAQALELSAPLVHVMRVPAGTAVGYDGTWVAERDTAIGVVGLGYADGIPRELRCDAWVAVRGTRRRVVGAVSMDQIVIELGDDPVARGETATVFGGDGPTLHEWAAWSGTIPHTIVTGIGRRVERTWT